jgi:hypothetical protein
MLQKQSEAETLDLSLRDSWQFHALSYHTPQENPYTIGLLS